MIIICKNQNGDVCWVPSASRKVAEEFSKNSEIKEDIYHGTKEIKILEAIKRDGFKFDPEKGRSTYGNGIYLTPERKIAFSYAKRDEERILKTKINVKRVKKYATEDEYDKEVKKFQVNTNEKDYEIALRKYSAELLKKHDAIVFDDLQYVIIDNPKRIMVINE